MIQVKQTMLLELLIAHMGTTENVTKSYHSLTYPHTPTQTLKVISIFVPRQPSPPTHTFCFSEPRTVTQ